MLQLILMREISDIFDYDRGKVNKLGLQNLICELNEVGFSSQFVNFIQEALAFDDRDRPDFVALKTQIFSLLSLENGERTFDFMRQSHGIKSSISSLYKSKEDIK